MVKVYGVIGSEGTIIAFQADGYRAAKRHLGRVRRAHLQAGLAEVFRWMTESERVKYARCLEWDD